MVLSTKEGGPFCELKCIVVVPCVKIRAKNVVVQKKVTCHSRVNRHKNKMKYNIKNRVEGGTSFCILYILFKAIKPMVYGAEKKKRPSKGTC